MNYLDQSVSALARFEGSVAWMYLDTRGHVTVGVGQMLSTEDAAELLPFRVQDRAATPKEIEADFWRVSEMPPGMPAAAYRVPASPTLQPADIDTLTRAALAAVDTSLRQRLGWYAGVPDVAKLAMLDMGYNLGISGLLNGFPRFLAAVRDGQWRQAATACTRQGPGIIRNRWTAQQLMAAATPPDPTKMVQA